MSEQNTDEISLKDFILKVKSLIIYLFYEWKVILFVGILGGLLGLAYSFTKKPIYTATLSFAMMRKALEEV